MQDPFEKLVKGFGLGRDPERTPMRWDGSEGGGFTSGKPWLPMDDHRACNVERQQADDRSLLQLYRRLIEMRGRHACLVEGDYLPLRARNGVLSYCRTLGRIKMRIGLNIAGEPRRREWQRRGLRLISSHLDRSEEPVEGPLLLRGNEGAIVMQDSP